MNGPKHYAAAETLVESLDTLTKDAAKRLATKGRGTADELAAFYTLTAATAQAHAALALVAITVEQTSHSTQWHEAAVVS